MAMPERHWLVRVVRGVLILFTAALPGLFGYQIFLAARPEDGAKQINTLLYSTSTLIGNLVPKCGFSGHLIALPAALYLDTPGKTAWQFIWFADKLHIVTISSGLLRVTTAISFISMPCYAILTTGNPNDPAYNAIASYGSAYTGVGQILQGGGGLCSGALIGPGRISC